MSRTPEFTAMLAPFKAASDKAQAQRDDAYRTGQAHQKSLRGKAAAIRQGDGADAESVDRALSEQKNAAARKWSAFGRANVAGLGRLLEIADRLDPREHAAELDDAVPILLMPLRIEARFAPGANVLWLRAYPDAWAVDGFEPLLSEVEVANARSFWSDFWAAGDGREMQVAAWRNLVANHGAGRAAWIVSQYRPLNEADRPGAVPAGTMMMAIDGAKPGPAEAEAIRQFWQAKWREPQSAAVQASALAALESAIGAGPAATAAANPPRRLDDPFTSAPRGAVMVQLVWLEWPVLALDDTKASSWTTGARTDMLPERLVVTLQQGDNRRSVIGNIIPPIVELGIDPSAPDADQFAQVDGDLSLPDAIAWIFDFDKAVEMGLGMRIELSPVERQRGFDRVVVCGLNLRDDSGEGRAKFATLISHHSASKTGMSLLPQGIPTNNSEKDSGWSAADDVAGSFARIFEAAPSPFDGAERNERLDGHWLAHWLGLDPAVIAPLGHALGRDQLEGRAINRALWPATIGYSLDSLLDGIVSDDAQRATRRFFEDYVLARDAVPQIRIGDQPYGILPASAWSRHAWFGGRKHVPSDETALTDRKIASFLRGLFGSADYPRQLHALLRIANAQWAALVPGTAHMSRPGDLHQTLLDILGLAPNSLEFHRRNADSMDQFANLMRAQGFSGLIEMLIASAKNTSALDLLRSMGYSGEEQPQILKFVFHGDQEKLAPILVDDVETSETEPVRGYTDDDRNYLRWLIDAGGSSLEALRVQAGFSDDEVPSALLYHLARHALQLSYQRVGIELLSSGPAPVLSPEARRAARRDAPFLHIAQQADVSESRYHHLYQPAPSITGSATLLLQDHIAGLIALAPETRNYRDVLAALALLEGTSTARLERLLTEHLDLCTYRLDAWKQGLLQLQLEFMREHHPSRPLRGGQPGDDGEAGEGLYLGAYGWLENLRPRGAPVPAQVPADLREAFKSGGAKLMQDPANLGYIHAPSLDQAQTAAVLRNSYVANADPAHPGNMAINLSSWRVRQATAVLEGLRNDQSLGELLGYRFERELHSNFALAETDEFVFALRKHFPLVANRSVSTYVDLNAGESIETIEARNVVDGEALLTHIRKSGNSSYPFGLGGLPGTNAAQRDKIDGAADLIANISDAVADLALAESVHQALKGKPESSAASLDAQGSGLFPPVSEFVATPREGTTLTLRSGVFFDPAMTAASPWSALAATPRSMAEPVLNHWLGQIFPAPGDIAVEVEDVAAATSTPISLADLSRQPIDWLYDLRLGAADGGAALDLLFEAKYRADNAPVDPKAVLMVRYRADVAGKTSLFRFAALVDTLRTLITTTRPMRPDDIALTDQAKEDRQGLSTIPLARASDALTTSDALAAELQTFVSPLTAELTERAVNAAAIRTALSGRLTAFAALCERAALLGCSELDPAIGLRWKRSWFIDLDTRLAATIADWERRLSEFHGYLVRFDTSPLSAPFGDIFAPLQRAERQISTTVTQPFPPDPATMRADLIVRAQAFSGRLDALRAARALVTDDADAWLTQLEAALPLTDFVPEDFAVSGSIAAFAVPTAEMEGQAKALLAALAKRKAEAEAKLAQHAATTDPEKQLKAMTTAMKAIFGEAFVAVPLITLAAAQQSELALCHAAEATLLGHQTTIVGDPLPLETWLHSAARVRDRLGAFEYAGFLAEALSGIELPLIAWQLPHKPGDHWLGASYPDEAVIDGDRLLFHAHHSVAFDPAKLQAGLLIDEWTEVIPAKDILTGVAFHYDRPGSEPPQTFLLMTPTDFRGGWTWADIVDGLNETLDAAKLRAVEPTQLDATAFAPLLPATLASTVHYPLSISLNYAVVNGFARMMVEGVH